MGSPSRLYRTFVGADGVRWGVEARLLGEGTDAIPMGFTFTSQNGERRMLDGSTPECMCWEQFCDPDWQELLDTSRLVRPATMRTTRPRYYAAGRSSRR
jgi:hypothetical protein